MQKAKGDSLIHLSLNEAVLPNYSKDTTYDDEIKSETYLYDSETNSFAVINYWQNVF